ncbi:heterokaryon incompatibility protein-domain-containing protein [Suillus paluster]|uniref:heterokaryon incompatibility protein-domain-containing protein n=1 Tax=Suillus paluster TaxID=48578 RepID=UPI001B86B49B|nr:heterokaryon incompatibility protein-domain-containing protein [Suillus paluster]KAG1734441.1 heterokaryon incompatibility protein-domain-containing protein [Suillus paluster]
MNESTPRRKKHCWRKQSQSDLHLPGEESRQGDIALEQYPRPSSWALSKLLDRVRKFVKAIKERFTRSAGRSPIPSPMPNTFSRPSQVDGTESLDPQPKSLQGKLVNATDEAINSVATEHTLCPTCQKSIDTSHLFHNPSRGSEDFRRYPDCETLEASSSAGGCHLCSLILGKIRQQQQPATGPITVTLQVSRSGGMTLLIQAGETGSQRMGYLVIVPVDDVETPTTCTSATGKFTFPSQSSYENARTAKSLASEASFNLAREWLQQCLQKHHKCMETVRAARTTNGPSRLIDVGCDDGVEPRVVISQELGETRLEYLTLSHCWGGAEILRLLKENIDSLKVGIPPSTLPKTFQDAIVITRRLGYQYLWIDSLCIIQNSPSDWRSESAIMGEIYANSTCTIAALTARNSHEGCFFDHARNPLFFRPCRVLDRWYVEANSNVGVDLRMGLSPLPLHTRAWVVQERILAPRTLYYGFTGLAWECTECSATEAMPGGEVSRFSPKASFFGIQQQTDEEKYGAWMDIQISYTQCHLTRFDDRLVAISGVIKRIEMLTGWENVWGLWREWLLIDMLWFVEEPTWGRPETDEYLAPTWSWMGVEGRVMAAIGAGEQRRWTAEVIDVGSLGERGYVRIKAMMRRVKCTTEWRLNSGIETPAPTWEEVDWDPDVILTTDDVEKEMWCLLVARLPEYLGGSEAFDIGLVVTPKGEEWARVGIFRQLREGNALFPENVVDIVEVAIV